MKPYKSPCFLTGYDLKQISATWCPNSAKPIRLVVHKITETETTYTEEEKESPE